MPGCRRVMGPQLPIQQTNGLLASRVPAQQAITICYGARPERICEFRSEQTQPLTVMPLRVMVP
jgi:hypothetical protein